MSGTYRCGALPSTMRRHREGRLSVCAAAGAWHNDAQLPQIAALNADAAAPPED
jgi:hypothetical protein